MLWLERQLPQWRWRPEMAGKGGGTIMFALNSIMVEYGMIVIV